MEKPIVKFEFIIDEIEIIINALAQQPYIKVAPIIQKIQKSTAKAIEEFQQVQQSD